MISKANWQGTDIYQTYKKKQPNKAARKAILEQSIPERVVGLSATLSNLADEMLQVAAKQESNRLSGKAFFPCEWERQLAQIHAVVDQLDALRAKG